MSDPKKLTDGLSTKEGRPGRRKRPLPVAIFAVDSSEQRAWLLNIYASEHLEVIVLPSYNLPEGDYAAVLAAEAGPDLREICREVAPPDDESPYARSKRTPREAVAIHYAPAATCLIERKSLGDMYGTLTAGRDRFEAELERMRPYGFRALVIEGDLPAITSGKVLTGATPQSIIGSLVALSQRFGIHVVFASDRRHAASYAFRLMERWCRDRAKSLSEVKELW